jgi:putative MATE family efflux protein
LEDRKQELGHENIGKLLLKYSVPAALTNVIYSIDHFIDTIFISRGIGTTAVASISVACNVHMIPILFIMVIGMGASSIISRKLGSGEQEKAEEVSGTSLVATSLIGLIWTLTAMFFAEPLIRLFGANDAIMPYARDYFSIIIMIAAISYPAMMAGHIIRSEGNTKKVLYITVISIIVNLVLTPVFIFGFGMGVKGAAIATVIGKLTSVFMSAEYFIKSKSLIKITVKNLKIHFESLPEILLLGSPAVMTMLTAIVSRVILNRSLIHYGSEHYIAIILILESIIVFFHFPVSGIMQGLQPIIGFNYGAKKMKRVTEALTLATLSSALILTFSFLVMMIFPAPIMSLFTQKKELISEAVPLIRIWVICTPLHSVTCMGTIFFQALGKAKITLFLSFLTDLIIQIPLMLILPVTFGLYGIFYSYPLSTISAFVVTLFLLIREVAALKKIPVQLGSTDFNPAGQNT